jgi:hypothetical protein
MAFSQFNRQADLEDGTVRVRGPFAPRPDPAQGVEIRFLHFLILQDGVVVEGTGDARGDRWVGTADVGGLQAGTAQAFGFAVVVKQAPLSFSSLTWSDEIELKPSQPGA